MAKSIINYDKDLPAINNRCAWLAPTSHLVKDNTAASGWREEQGRRASELLLVPKIRQAVDKWRNEGYPGASATAERLLTYWFEEEHNTNGFNVPFRYHFCQREAIETLIWLVEITKQKDAVKLIKKYGTIYKKDLMSNNIEFEIWENNERKLRRYIPEKDKYGLQDLPPEDLRRFAIKLATGAGKTWVMAMTVVYSYFHKRQEKTSPLSDNFLLIAPNVIVYQRLEGDFSGNRIFNQLPLIPPEWKDKFLLKPIMRDNGNEPSTSGNLFLTNVQQLYQRETEWTAEDAVDALLGKPVKKDTNNTRPMLERVKSLNNIIAINDEAHHVHDDELAWNTALLNIHQALPQGVVAWLDFSATPKDQNGMYYPWTVTDYPLAQVVEDRIVKSPLIVTMEDDPQKPAEEPDRITKENVVEKYGYWIQSAVNRWQKHYEILEKTGVRPILFVMTEKSAFADAIGRHLWESRDFKEEEVLIIHTDTAGVITKRDLDKARQAAHDIDKQNSKIKAVVSVMMLREGWDVRNVSVVLGLRPFSAKAEILPEQVVGRGLRLMRDIGPDIQTLEVLGTPKLLNFLREQLEAEGVGVGTSSNSPPDPIMIAPIQEKKKHDIAIPITKPLLWRNWKNLSKLKVEELGAIYEQQELDKVFRNKLKMEFAPAKIHVHTTTITPPALEASELVADITKKIAGHIKLQGNFAKLFPIVEKYITFHCFGKKIDITKENIRLNLGKIKIREGIAKYLAKQISTLVVETGEIEFEQEKFLLSSTKPFQWRRNLPPPLKLEKTVFNFVATYNGFEREFAKFLDRASDVARFAALGTTEQGESGSQFRVDYLKTNGAMGYYYPDWVAVQKKGKGEINWIIETKGRVWENTEQKDAAMLNWCNRITVKTGKKWRYIRVNQINFDRVKDTATTLKEIEISESNAKPPII